MCTLSRNDQLHLIHEKRVILKPWNAFEVPYPHLLILATGKCHQFLLSNVVESFV